MCECANETKSGKKMERGRRQAGAIRKRGELNEASLGEEDKWKQGEGCHQNLMIETATIATINKKMQQHMPGRRVDNCREAVMCEYV